jgi:ABC-type branched-subunit amino acid transport system ATPase component
MLLKVENLTVCYGKREIIKNISINVDEGSIVSIIGPNGAGKSTTIKAIGGLIELLGGQITCGDILFKEVSVKNKPTNELPRHWNHTR